MSDSLRSPLRVLADSEYDWAGADELILDDRYRRRHLPVLRPGPRLPMSADTIGPGEVWPPVRAVVLPLIDPVLHRAGPIARFLDDVRRSSLAGLVWWDGLELRADRMHATVTMPELPGEAAFTAATGALNLVVRGPWIGRYNRGRIYLPIGVADDRSARVVTALRAAAGVENRPLLSGFLQLTSDVTGAQYVELRELIHVHQSAIEVPVRCEQIWLMDTMDDLVLRSEVVRRHRLN